MTEQEKNFNKWFDEYNIEKIKVFEEPDLKIAYLQGCADEVEKWEEVNGELRAKNAELKKELEISRRCWQDQKNISLDTNCLLHEAKEIIREYVRIAYEIFSNEFDARFANRNLLEKAEQFLEE